VARMSGASRASGTRLSVRLSAHNGAAHAPPADGHHAHPHPHPHLSGRPNSPLRPGSSSKRPGSASNRVGGKDAPTPQALGAARGKRKLAAVLDVIAEPLRIIVRRACAFVRHAATQRADARASSTLRSFWARSSPHHMRARTLRKHFSRLSPTAIPCSKSSPASPTAWRCRGRRCTVRICMMRDCMRISPVAEHARVPARVPACRLAGERALRRLGAATAPAERRLHSAGGIILHVRSQCLSLLRTTKRKGADAGAAATTHARATAAFLMG
jgi:hypothetical protein